MKTKILLTVVLLTTTLYSAAQLKVGDTAPDFKLKNIDHQMVALSDYSNQKGVVIAFTCNHCPYAKLYEQRLIGIQSAYGPKGFPVVAINPNDPDLVPDDSFEKMVNNAREKGFNFPYLVDDQSFFKQYGATRTPHIFLLKREGEGFRVAYIGAIDDNPQNADDVQDAYLAQAIEALLKGENPAVTETKAIGCSIKFKK